jgi:hypothetical protein
MASLDHNAKPLRELLDAFADAVAATGPLGMPSGHLYVVAMGHFTLTEYETIMRVLVAQGRVVKRGMVYYGT